MSGRTFYNAVLAAAQGVAGIPATRVTEDDQAILSSNGALPALVVRALEGRLASLEIGSASEAGLSPYTGAFSIPVDLYIPRGYTRAQFNAAVDSVTLAFDPTAMVGNQRPVVTTDIVPHSTAAATSGECDVGGYSRVRFVVSGNQYL